MANIDQAENASQRLSFKILDFTKPLLFLFKQGNVRRKIGDDTRDIQSCSAPGFWNN